MGRKDLKESCSGPCPIICSSCLCILWVCMIPVILLCHVAIAKVIPELQDLPDNLKKGFNVVLKFDQMESDSLAVKAAATKALQKCTVAPTSCSNLPTNSLKSTTAVELTEIQTLFSNTLTTIHKVATDKYLGTDAMASTATQLTQVIADMETMKSKTNDAYCQATNPTYCNIYKNAGQIVAGTATVKVEIDKFYTSDQVKKFKEYSGQLAALHTLPWLSVIAMLFLTCFWAKDGACICCDGSALGCLGACLHFLFWFIFFILSLVTFVVGYAIRNQADQIPTGGVLKGDPKLDVLLEHIEANYPAFWALVFKDLGSAFGTLYGAVTFCVLLSVLIAGYGLLLCAVRPYKQPA